MKISVWISIPEEIKMTKGFLDKKIVNKIKKTFTPGMRIELIKMGEDIQRVPNGTRGTVRLVDDAGTIHMNWDTGSSLGLIVGEDLFRIVEEEEHCTSTE